MSIVAPSSTGHHPRPSWQQCAIVSMLPNSFAFSFAGPGDGGPAAHSQPAAQGAGPPTLFLDETVDHEELQELRPYEAWLEVPVQAKMGSGRSIVL